MAKQMDDLVKIERSDFEQIENKIEEIQTLALQALTGTDQQRISCLDHIIAWTHKINFYKNRGMR